MSSSMQLAADCLREEDGPQETHPVEGIEMFAHAIDSSEFLFDGIFQLSLNDINPWPGFIKLNFISW